MTSARPDKRLPHTLSDLSMAVHAGNAVDPGTRALRVPLVMANSYELPDDPSSISWSATDPGALHPQHRSQPGGARGQARRARGRRGRRRARNRRRGPARRLLHARPRGRPRRRERRHVRGDLAAVDRTPSAALRHRGHLRRHHRPRRAARGDAPRDPARLRRGDREPHDEGRRHRRDRRIAHERDAILMVDSTFTPPPFYRPTRRRRRPRRALPHEVHQRPRRRDGRRRDRAPRAHRADQGRRDGRRRRRDLAVQRVADPPRLGHAAASTPSDVRDGGGARRVPRSRPPRGIRDVPGSRVASRSTNSPPPVRRARLRRHDRVRRDRRTRGAEPVRLEPAPHHLGVLARSRRFAHRARRRTTARVSRPIPSRSACTATCASRSASRTPTTSAPTSRRHSMRRSAADLAAVGAAFA